LGVQKVGFVVLAHQLPEQLERLLDALESPVSRFYLHIDRRASAVVYSDVQKRLRQRTDVTFMRRRKTEWGSFGLVLVILEGIRIARQDGAETVVVLTGQDYPIKPRHQVLAFLAEHRDKSFVEHNALPRPDWPAPGGTERLIVRGFRFLGREWLWKNYGRWTQRLPERSVDLSPRHPFHGSQICTLNAQACDYLLEHLLNDRRLQRQFRVVEIPDEMAIPTVLANSDLRDSLVNDNLCFADWSAKEPHPEVLTPAHMDALRSTSALFARKFNVREHPTTLDLVDRNLRDDSRT
jgi:hypothetical protein